MRAIRYRADFCYEERGEVCAGGAGGSCEYVWRKVVEDVKCRATRTQKYIIKRKLMKERFDIDIREV